MKNVAAKSIATFLLFLLAPIGSEAGVVREEVRGAVTARATFDSDKASLSGDIALSLTVEGPQRVEVVPPRPLLTKASSQSWRVREMGLPLVENLEKGRQSWKQEFRLSPYVAGPKIEIELAPLKVKAGGALEMEINWSQSLEVEVTTSIAQPDPQLLRPITDIEPLPAAPAVPQVRRHWLIVLAVAIGAVATLAFVFMLAFRGGKRDEAIRHDAAWALLELAAIDRNNGFARLAEIVRLFLRDCLGVPATHLTTTELILSLDQVERIGPPASELRQILERCDVAKFNGNLDGSSDANDCAEWTERAKQFIRRLSSVETANRLTSLPE